MFARLRAALRRGHVPPTRSPSKATPVGSIQCSIVPDTGQFTSFLAPEALPVRTPGLAAARRHTWTGVHHGLGALRAVDAWTDVRHDPARGSEADVQHTAAIHQLDTALAELRAARKALIEGTRR